MGLTTRFWRPLAMCLAVMCAAACGDGTRTTRAGDGASQANPIVAATVNGKPIYISDVEAEAVSMGLVRAGESFDPASDEFYQLLEDLIERRLLALEAERRQMDRSADVRHRLERARELVLAGALNEQIRDTAIDEGAIERMYREQVRLRRNTREVHLRQIVLADRDAAIRAKRRLDSGESFEALAYEISIDRATGTEGGDAGFQQIDDLADGIREAATSTPVGQVAGPVQAGGRWILIKIDNRREAPADSMEGMRPRIEQYLMFQEGRRLLEKLKKQSRIERFIDEGGRVAATPSSPGQPRDARVRAGQAPMGPGGVAAAAGQESPAAPAAAAPPAAAPKTGVAGAPKAAPVRPPPADTAPEPVPAPPVLPPGPATDERET
ncbi:MAG: peptidyl-prolyl cis-trans isomerase [Hyphomonadaceae bacterium]|nr:peptidyl-prolyl cis-trans isomerase [Hyphomonadaceae bacterium]